MLVDEAGPSGLVVLDLAAVLVEAKARRLLGVEGRGGKAEAFLEQDGIVDSLVADFLVVVHVELNANAAVQPVYLTKNGSASLVVMDAEAYDEQTRALSAIQEREERIQRAITRGYDGLVNGRVRPWKQAKADADRIRAARHEIG